MAENESGFDNVAYINSIITGKSATGETFQLVKTPFNGEIRGIRTSKDSALLSASLKPDNSKESEQTFAHLVYVKRGKVSSGEVFAIQKVLAK